MRGRWYGAESETGTTRRLLAWRFLRLVMLGGIVLGLVRAGGFAGTAEAQTGTVGQWSAPFSWPNVAIHTTLLPTGKVLSYSYPQNSSYVGQSESWLWNPANFQVTEVPVVNGTNIFCSGHALQPDGKLVSFGGTDPDSPQPTFWGQAEVNRFNPTSQVWSLKTTMSQARWYPAVTTLGDGRLLISSGIDGDGDGNDEQEIYDPSSGAVSQLPSSANRYTTLYPWQYLLPNGRVLSLSNGANVGTLNLSNNTWSELDESNFGARDQGTATMLPLKAPGYNPEVIIISGGFPSATNTVERINMGAGSPSWSYVGGLQYSRRHANSTLLPDGKVLVTGGTGRENDPALARLAPEMFDPATNSWITMASAQRPRMYHSTSILLPDARVLMAGTDGEFTAEIYSPPYLFKGSRPVISTAPSAIGWGSGFQVSTPNAGNISKVMLIKPSSVTHSVNMGQRAIELGFSAGSGVLTVNAPPSGNVAPPGHYMLFIVNSNGVPSVASWVHLSGSPPPPTATPTQTPTPTPTPAQTPTPTSTPTPIPTAAPTPTPTQPPGGSPADLDCDGKVTSIDALQLLRFSAGLPVEQNNPCPNLGTAIGGGGLMGDVDCNGSVNAADAVVILRIASGMQSGLACD